MKTLRFSLRLSEQELLKYYRGHARNVMVEDAQGKTMAFPIEVIRPFVTKEGVYGRFEMTVDDNFKFIDIKKLGEL